MPAGPATVEAIEVRTSRLRTRVLECGRRDAPVHGNVSSAHFFAATIFRCRYECPGRAMALRGRRFARVSGFPRPGRRKRAGVRDLADDLHALLADSDLVPDGQRVHLLGWSLGRGVVL